MLTSAGVAINFVALYTSETYILAYILYFSVVSQSSLYIKSECAHWRNKLALY
jgi:hypothetical protein